MSFKAVQTICLTLLLAEVCQGGSSMPAVTKQVGPDGLVASAPDGGLVRGESRARDQDDGGLEGGDKGRIGVGLLDQSQAFFNVTSESEQSLAEPSLANAQETTSEGEAEPTSLLEETAGDTGLVAEDSASLPLSVDKNGGIADGVSLLNEGEQFFNVTSESEQSLAEPSLADAQETTSEGEAEPTSLLEEKDGDTSLGAEGDRRATTEHAPKTARRLPGTEVGIDSAGNSNTERKLVVMDEVVDTGESLLEMKPQRPHATAGRVAQSHHPDRSVPSTHKATHSARLGPHSSFSAISAHSTARAASSAHARRAANVAHSIPSAPVAHANSVAQSHRLTLPNYPVSATRPLRSAHSSLSALSANSFALSKRSAKAAHSRSRLHAAHSSRPARTGLDALSDRSIRTGRSVHHAHSAPAKRPARSARSVAAGLAQSTGTARSGLHASTPKAHSSAAERKAHVSVPFVHAARQAVSSNSARGARSDAIARKESPTRPTRVPLAS